MDPTACLDLAIGALLDSDWEAAFEHACDLLTWLNRGGFPPTGVEAHDAHDLARVIMCKAARKERL